MKRLNAIRTKLSNSWQTEDLKILNSIISKLIIFPSLQSEFISIIVDLDNQNNLNETTLTTVNDNLQKKYDLLAIPKRKKLIFKIMDEYLEYIYKMLSNKNESKQFTSIAHAFATELSVKLLFILTQIDITAREITGIDYLFDKELSNEDKSKIAYEVDNYCMSVDNILPKSTNRLGDVFKNIDAKKINDDFVRKAGGEPYGSHANVKYLNVLPNHLKTLINYYAMKFFAQDGIDPNSKDFEDVDYIDYILMIKDFGKIEKEIKREKALSETNSERFFWNRYDPVEENTDINYQFTFALALATYLVFKETKQKYYEDSVKKVIDTSELPFISNLYTEDIKQFLDNDNKKKLLLIELNKYYPEFFVEINNSLSPIEFECLIKRLNVHEIRYLFNEVKMHPELNNICDLIRYAINFKNKLSDFSKLNLNSKKYARINVLFKKISDIEDLSYVGAQLRNWLDSINLYELTPEEVIELNKIDPRFIFSQLDYRSQLIYRKCEELQIPFRYYYRRFTNTQLELLFDIYKKGNVEIPIFAGSLTNLEIMALQEKAAILEGKDPNKPLLLNLNDMIFEKISLSIPNSPISPQPLLLTSLITKKEKEELLTKKYGYSASVIKQLKDVYLDADLKTIEVITKYYGNDVDKLNDVPPYIVLCSFDRLSYLLKLHNGNLDEICEMPIHEFTHSPNVVNNDTVYGNGDIASRRAFMRLGNKKWKRIVSGVEEMCATKVKRDYPIISVVFHPISVGPEGIMNLSNIMTIVKSEEKALEILKLFLGENYKNDPNDKNDFPKELLIHHTIVNFIYKLVEGDFNTKPDKTVRDMKFLLKFLTNVSNLSVLQEIAKTVFNKPLVKFRLEDFKRIPNIPDYVVRSNAYTIKENLRLYLFELKLNMIPKRKGIKLINPEEIELSYNRLVEFMTEGLEDEEALEEKTKVHIEPLMYIDYTDVCHLINTYNSLPEEVKLFVDKKNVLDTLNYISLTGYKIDVHTFGPKEFKKIYEQEHERLRERELKSKGK